MKLYATTAKLIVAGALFCAVSQLAAADWSEYQAPSYGFSMLIPGGAKMKEAEAGGGWSMLAGGSGGVKVYGASKPGEKEKDADIEKFAAQVIGIPTSDWKMIDKGKGRGFERYRTFQAGRANKLFYGGYGVGANGNYFFYVETTVDDYEGHRADYKKWYESIHVE